MNAFRVIVMLLIVWGVFSCSTHRFESARTAAPEPQRSPAQIAAEEKEAQAKQARYACKQYIEERLHDRASAEFPSWTNSYTEKRPKDWLVQMEVRAKNGFGAARLGMQECIVTISGDNIKLISLKSIK